MRTSIMASTIILCFMLTILSVLTINSASSMRVEQQTTLDNVVDASMKAIPNAINSGYFTLIPTNFNIYNPTENDECDNNSYTRGSRRAQATIVPPTGSENIIIYILIGIGCLVILSGGIILIKKKVL